MKLTLPIRAPRDEPSLKDYQHFDHETVTQDDGRRAQFTWDSQEADKGWQFSCWRDEQNFILLEGENQVGELARLLLDSTLAKNRERHEAWLEREAKRPKLSPEEQLINFSKFMLPIIANVAPDLIIGDILSVQPMAESESTKMEIVYASASELRS